VSETPPGSVTSYRPPPVGNLPLAGIPPRRGTWWRVTMALGLAVLGLAAFGAFLYKSAAPEPEIEAEKASEPESETPPAPRAIVARDTAGSAHREGIAPRPALPAPADDPGPIDRESSDAIPRPPPPSTDADDSRRPPPIPTDAIADRPTRPTPIEVPLADRARSFRYPKPAAEIRANLREILAEPKPPGVSEELAAALRRLNAYRYLAGLPYRHLTFDDHLNQSATAAADICRRLGHLSHTPENPGMPAEQFERASLGAKNSNLAFGALNLAAAVDMWMGDSDEMNIDRLGHRRWCLNPSMRKIGMGRVGEYTAMWVTDVVDPPFEDFTFIGHPSPGYMPIDFFESRDAWSITLNPRDFRPPRMDRVEVRIYRVEGHVVEGDHPVELDYFTVENRRFGLPNCLIFRPRSLEVEDGQRYWVEVKGLERAEGAPTDLRYLVEFIH
jgi:uncharacterized protein YkwD